MSFCSWTSQEVYRDHFADGVYVCAKCGNELFLSVHKYAHESPWPAFTHTVHEGSVSKALEYPGANKVSCNQCGQSLGHEFLRDGPGGDSRF